MTRWLKILAVAVVTVLPLAASAERPLMAPHDMTWSTASCDKCHSLYVTQPSGAADWNPGCTACHNSLPAAKVSKGFPWFTSDQATPKQGGSQHNWSGVAVNGAAGAQAPSNGAVTARLVDGKLQCTVCHDAHDSGSAYAPTSFKVNVPLNTALQKTGGVGTGTLTLLSAGTVSKAYRVRVATAGTLVVSHDFALATPTWTAPIPFTLGATVTLDDPAVQVRIGGTPAVDDYWDFYMSYPFLRTTNVADSFCNMCHAERVMTHVRASGADPLYAPNGVRKFSHPVGVALNANGQAYDRTAATMLDASGVAQSTGDGNKTNDLVLDGGVVRCTTCHAVHNADSNSLSVDAR